MYPTHDTNNNNNTTHYHNRPTNSMQLFQVINRIARLDDVRLCSGNTDQNQTISHKTITQGFIHQIKKQKTKND